MAVGALLTWLVFAFGGIYPGTLAVPALLLLGLAIAYRPVVFSGSREPQLDWFLFLSLAAIAFQLLPLPRTLLALLTPEAEPLARTLQLVDPGGPLPISIDLPSTAGALGLFGASVLLFVTCRQIFESGGVRTLARWIAIVGLIVSGIALAQDATAKGLMYWRWRTADEGPAPFGPFVNRNHFATWAVMAIPLSIGYLAAHGTAHRGAHAYANWQHKVVTALDARAVLLVLSAAALILGVAASLSRSGLVGLAAALATGGLLAHRHEGAALTRSTRPAIFIIALGGIAAFAVLTQVGPSAMVGRFAAADVALADRGLIWRDALTVARKFWLTGTGAGTFETAMAVYQTSSPGVIYNQAHNHFLQVAAEGGLLVSLPAALAALAFVRAAMVRLRDKSGMYWVRVGAAAGLTGAAVQNVFETGLTTPANAALAAVLAAILIHVPARSSAESGDAHAEGHGH